MAITSSVRQHSCLEVMHLTVVLGLIVEGSAAAQRSAPPTPSVSATGCLVQRDSKDSPVVGHEQEGARGLALTRAVLKAADGRALGDTRPSATPGSSPSGSGTGTTDRVTTTNGKSDGAVERSFWIVGPKAPELIRLEGRRVEITGTLDPRNIANPGTAADAGASARRSPSAPAEPSGAAHPSAPSQVITVASFRLLGDDCR